MSRWLRAPSWNETGDEPDYRFTLANERTLLAWIRTGLALVAGAVALTQLEPDSGRSTAIAAVLAVAGAVLPVLAYRRWARTQQAMRRSEPLDVGGALGILSLFAGALGAVLLALVVL